MENSLISFIFLFLAFVGYKKDKSVIGPLFIMPFIWGVFLFLYTVIPHGLYDLQSQFLAALLLWVLFFLLGAYAVSLKNSNTNSFIDNNFSLYNKQIFNVFFYLVIIFSPLVIIALVTEAMKVGFEYFFLKLRMINTGIDDDDTFTLGPLAYVFNFTNVVLLLFTFYKDKVSNIKYYLVLIFAVLLGLITLARTSLVVLFLSIFVILYLKRKLKKWHYLAGAMVFFVFIVLITFLRSLHESNSTGNNELLIYLFAGMPAFDQVNYIAQEQFGIYTFRFFYALLNSFGGNYIVEKTILPYSMVPELTNVYTVMFPFYKDFGYLGLIIFGFMYGILTKFTFNSAVKGNNFAILFYSMIFPVLLLQFFGEYLFSNLSTYLQYVIILLIPKMFKIIK